MELRNSNTVIYLSFGLLTALLFYDLITKIYFHIVIVTVLYIVYKRVAKQREKKINVNGQGVFITGCDTGFGHEAALRLAKTGFTVFAGCLKPEGKGAINLVEKGGERLYVVPLDVADDASVEKALETVKKDMPETGLWAVINNAAIEFAAEIEFARLETMKRVDDVNYYGIVRVTKAFLPLIRQSKGRVVNVSSVKGRLGVARDAAYVSAKWAGEAFSDILRREMYRFGVKVAIIEPGQFGAVTSILQGERLRLAEAELNDCWEIASDEIKAAYGRESIDSLIEDLRNDCKGSSNDVNLVIDAMQDAVVNVNPKCRYLVHGSNKFLDKICKMAQFRDRTHNVPTFIPESQRLDSEGLIYIIQVLAVLNQYSPEPLMDFIYRLVLPLPVVKQGVR